MHRVISVRLGFTVAPYFQLKKLVFFFNLIASSSGVQNQTVSEYLPEFLSAARK